jgi:hypothetical protein
MRTNKEVNQGFKLQDQHYLRHNATTIRSSRY